MREGNLSKFFQIFYSLLVIEPRFQRDFISLLPRELALNVLSNLSPRDLMNCAQTCKTWRHLADDNLLWSRKCRAEGINGKFMANYDVILLDMTS